MDEPQSFGALLGEVLARDRALLGRKEELLAALEGRVSGAQVWAYRSLARAVRETNVAEAMLAADAQDAAGRKHAAEDAARTLRALGMQERAVHRVIDAIVEALDWEARAAEEDARTAAAAEDAAGGAAAVEDAAETAAVKADVAEVEDAPPMTTQVVLVGTPYPAAFAPPVPAPPAAPVVWTCRCGHAGNHGKFCVICGLPRADGEVAAADVWTCVCGRAKNTGKFCVACGRSREDGDSRTHASLVWACACGRRGNKGNFCTACGRPRTESEVELWTCTCGREGNAGRFCTACGRSRAEGERR